MFHIFQEERLLTVCMLSFFGLSLVMRIFLGVIYRHMIREADNMASTGNRLLKQCKLKFANCYQLNSGVSNIPVFVDKFLNRLSMGPVSFDTLYHLSGQAMLLSIVCAGIGICKGIIEGRLLGEILPFYIVSFLGLYLYFSVSAVVDVKGKKRVLKVNLVDYLENHLSARMDMTEEDLEMLYGGREYGPEEYRILQSRMKDSRARAPRAAEYPGRRRKRQGALWENGKRTVELMPIGGRIRAREEPVEKAAGDTFEGEGADSYRPERDARVSEEELEELLREFLV